MAKTSLSKGDVLRADIIKDNYILSGYIVKVYDFSEDKLLQYTFRAYCHSTRIFLNQSKQMTFD